MKYLKNFITISNKKKLVTHDGSFHADDVFACATLCLVLEKRGEKFKIIRTRDEKIIKTGDYVFDVGAVYDEENNRFDHHQIGGAGRRENGIEYSSFGLVWKKFGKKLSGSPEAVLAVDKHLVSPVDANDNGVDLVERKHEVFPYTIQDFFRVMRPTWREGDRNLSKMFLQCVSVAQKILEREITYAQDSVAANKAILSTYQSAEDKRLIVLDKNYHSSEILDKLPELLFAVYPREDNGSWGVKAVRKDLKSFENRKNFPKSWGGLRNEELQKVTGVADAIFCHRALFMAVAKSKEGAVKLAQIALKS